MRSFYFTAKNIGRERYLTYTMGEGMELDEDILDFCEENEPPEILRILYEEDDDFDYLTYDVTGLMTLENYTQGIMDKEKVFKILRNIALGMISVKENAMPLSYIILSKGFMYINPDTLDIQFMYLPVESEGSVSTEFKSFVRQLIAKMKYNVDEDLAYVGQLLTYINGDGFNLRGLINLTEAIMKDSGISFEAESDISTDDGTEILTSGETEAVEEEPETDQEKAMDFMNELEGSADNLPEIGDDEDENESDESESGEAEDGIELEDVTENKEVIPEITTVKSAAEAAEALEIKTEKSSSGNSVDEISEEELMAKLAEIEELEKEEREKEAQNSDSRSEESSMNMQKPVKVSRAAMLKATAEHLEEEAKEVSADEAVEQISGESKNRTENKNTVTEVASEVKKDSGLAPSKDIIDNTLEGNAGIFVINPYITRETTGEKVVIMKPVFKIGKASRGVDFHVGGNGAVSRQHAIIVHKGDSYYIKDNKSTNHTYVDGKEIGPDEEVLLKNNSTITIGGEDFVFKLS